MQMNQSKGAVTIAEGSPDYKTDVDIAFNNVKDKKSFVLRTTMDSIGLWRTKHGVSKSGFKVNDITPQKWAARIDRDCWVFGVDCTKAEDIVAAVKIGMKFYDATASDLISDIYVKNLNIEDEANFKGKARIMANQSLYEGVCRAIVEAGKRLGVSHAINFYVFSNKKNPKIPKDNLHMALRDGGAESVGMDGIGKYKYSVASNDGRQVFENLITHLHLAKITPR